MHSEDMCVQHGCLYTLTVEEDTRTGLDTSPSALAQSEAEEEEEDEP